jgi:hypothetical protein
VVAIRAGDDKQIKTSSKQAGQDSIWSSTASTLSDGATASSTVSGGGDDAGGAGTSSSTFFWISVAVCIPVSLRYRATNDAYLLSSESQLKP